MAGQRSLRLRRTLMRTFAAAEISEPLESRRLLAAVSDEYRCEDAGAETATENNSNSPDECGEEECFPQLITPDEIISDWQPADGDMADQFAPFTTEDLNGGSEFTPFIAVCEVPEEWMHRLPTDGEPDLPTFEFVCETQGTESITVTDEDGSLADAEGGKPQVIDGEWMIDWQTVRGFQGDLEYVAAELPEPEWPAAEWPEAEWPDQADFADWQVVEQARDDEVHWSADTDTGADSNADMLLFGVVDDFTFPVFAAENSFLPDASEPGGGGIILRTLTLTVPPELSPSLSRFIGTDFVPEQRRAESMFDARSGLSSLSADRAADAKLALARNETRSAAPGTFVPPLAAPKRLMPAMAAGADNFFEHQPDITEASQQLDIFGEDRTDEDRPPARSEQSPANHVDAAGPAAADAANASQRQSADRAAEPGGSVTVSAEARSTAVASSSGRNPQTR